MYKRDAYIKRVCTEACNGKKSAWTKDSTAWEDANWWGTTIFCLADYCLAVQLNWVGFVQLKLDWR